MTRRHDGTRWNPPCDQQRERSHRLRGQRNRIAVTTEPTGVGIQRERAESECRHVRRMARAGAHGKPRQFEGEWATTWPTRTYCSG